MNEKLTSLPTPICRCACHKTGDCGTNRCCSFAGVVLVHTTKQDIRIYKDPNSEGYA